LGGEAAVAYTYKLYDKRNDGQQEERAGGYTGEELNEMTTFQLRGICQKERLVEGVIGGLEREGLIRTILKFRNAEEARLIDSFRKGGFERLQETLKRYLGTPLPDDGSIEIPAKVTLYSGMEVNRTDGYRVKAASAITESNVLIVNDHLELCGILNLVRDGRGQASFYLKAGKTAEIRQSGNRSYSLLFFRKQDSEYLYKTYYASKPMPPASLYYWKIPVADLEIRQPEETGAVLAIDFGTTNTTAGAYLDSGYVSSPGIHDQMNGRVHLDRINLVAFPGITEEESIELLPAAVAVADCSAPDHITYTFGSSALAMAKRNGYGSQSALFRGIKRWVNDYKKTEEVTDPSGNAATVSRADIIRAYMLYIIRTAEHQFKCRFRNLHISAPVKLKEQFSRMFKEILPEYRLETDYALDEGMAVLYNTIAEQIGRNGFAEGETHQALVIDCGGGTTDLSSCRFSIEDGQLSYKIDIHTTYENGDTNFGGNNITFRILQYMKIAFADYYRNGTGADIDTLITVPGADLFRYVDEHGAAAVYQTFEERYSQAESVIPTRFKEYENESREDYLRVRGNFHQLWEMAEEMKKEFYRKTGILRNRFHSGAGDGREHDLKLTHVERWCLSLQDNGRFREVHELPDIVFNIQEINQLIRGDIYGIVRKFLEDFYQNGQLQNYSMIKLSGQSCRIDVFREALKEFVPGRSIEFRQKAEDSGKVPELKLACLKGAIRFLHARKTGAIEASITGHAPAVPYSVSAFTHNNREKVLIDCHERLNRAQGFISRPAGVEEVELFLKDAEGNVRQRYVYMNAPAAYKPVTFEDIAEVYGDRIPQDDTDSIANGEVKFFIFSGGDNWGFHAVPVSRASDQLQLGESRYFAFENDLSELDFFDGLK
jgi:hypothetical protein